MSLDNNPCHYRTVLVFTKRQVQYELRIPFGIDKIAAVFNYVCYQK